MAAPLQVIRPNYTLRIPTLRGQKVSVLESDRVAVDSELSGLLRLPEREASPVREAMRYAVLGGGQRIRPVLALRMARLVGGSEALSLRAAAAIELIHCASLVVDDLPSMDNEATRRGKPAVHVAFGEATALLAAFGLVALAARCPVEIPCVPAMLSGVIRFQIELLKVLDANGLCDGQDLDLRVSHNDRDRLRSRVNELKTVPLFELCAHAAVISADPESSQAGSLRQFSREFGRAFQLVDDFLDGELDDASTANRCLDSARRCLLPLAPAAGELHELIDYLHARIQQ